MNILSDREMKKLCIELICKQDDFIETNRESVCECYVKALYNDYDSIISIYPSLSIDDILYSKYYWLREYINEFCRNHGDTDRFEDQVFRVLEEMDICCSEPINWDIVEKINNGKLEIEYYRKA